MNNATFKSEIVKSYLEKFPQTKHQTLAKKIKEETGLIFNNLDQVRSMIRHFTGSMGDSHRKSLVDRRFMRTETVQSTNNKYDIPESDALDYHPFLIPKAQNRILVVPDAHIPYHCVDTMTATIDWGKEHDINTVLMLGDWLDMHELSYFMKNPNTKRWREEREIFWQVLDVWQNSFPNAVFYYVLANHERRFENYLMTNAPRVYDTEEHRLDINLRLGERSIIPIMDKIVVKAGKLSLIHGDEYRGGAANLVSPARWLFNKAIGNTATAHFHKTSDYSKPNIDEELIGTWSIGCQCNLHPQWLPKNEWNNGFARVVVNPDGTFKMFNARIHEGKVL